MVGLSLTVRNSLARWRERGYAQHVRGVAALLLPGLAKSATPPAPKPRVRARGFLRVLLVDDEEMVRRSVVRTLTDCEVVCASSGPEALAILGGTPTSMPSCQTW
ncbi:MAG: hypothetical protein WDO74_35065 [Pseudomonadota bacterium]